MVFELVKLRYFHRKQPSLSETVDLAGKQLVPTDEQTNKKTKKTKKTKKPKKQKKKTTKKTDIIILHPFMPMIINQPCYWY